MYVQMKQLRFKAAVKQALSTAIIVALVVSISGKWESLAVYGPAMNHLLVTSEHVPYIPKRLQLTYRTELSVCVSGYDCTGGDNLVSTLTVVGMLLFTLPADSADVSLEYND